MNVAAGNMPDTRWAVLRALLAITLLLALAGCVTETTGGFNAEVSEEQALSDYLALARGYLEQEDITNAKRHLENATSIDRNNAEVYSIWGLVYAREGEVDLADENFRRSLRIDADNSQTRNNYAAFLFSSGRFEDAFKQLKIVVQDTSYPARPQAFENLGLAALRINQLDDAELAFTRAVQLNSNQARSILELVNLNLVKQDISKAAGFYRNYLTLLQFYNVGHNARSLWIGIQLAFAQGDEETMKNLGTQLEAGFRSAPENQLYQQLLEARGND